MTERIPKKIDHIKYTDKGVILEGVINTDEAAKELLRFNEAVLEIASEIHYHLEFDIDLSGNRFVQGQLQTRVILQCQRCMENMETEIKCQVNTAFVCDENEEHRAEESGYETFWLARREYLDPRVLIEDELLLSLPQIAMHELSQIGSACQAEVVFLDSDESMSSEVAEPTEVAEDNPFAVLQKLKTKS